MTASRGIAMTYLDDFRIQINDRNFSKFMQLWEEYCTSDHVDAEEFTQLLTLIKNSEFAKPFGKIVETALPLLQAIPNKEDANLVFKALIDLQTTNSPLLAEMALQTLKEKYGHQPQFNERLRLVGLRSKENFQSAIANYELLAHMEKSKFVFHAGGWGTGEIIEVSPVRQQVTIEFENVSGRKHLTFEHAFKALIPLADTHFLVKRFDDPDALEQEARKDPVGVIKMLLRDLGPKTSAEIKEELCELVIPEADWAKWWQGARAKLKKDMMIDTPESLREQFRLRKTELTHKERLQQSVANESGIDDIIQTTYSFVRDLPSDQQSGEVKNSLKEKLLAQLSSQELTKGQELQICLLLETQFDHLVEGKESSKLLQKHDNIEEIINSIDVVALRKRALVLIRQNRKDWPSLFLHMLLNLKQSTLRDYILKELAQGEHRKLVEDTLLKLTHHPETHPDFFVWYFQKVVGKPQDNLPLSDKSGQCQLFEAFLVLFTHLENKPEERDLLKKMYTLLSEKRFSLVRTIMADSSLEFVKEFLLLASKCHTLEDHDIKILRSLAEVVHPVLNKREARSTQDSHVIWTTEEAYRKLQEQIRHIGTVEIVENAREIEAARALGDLRENSEYKFALERRSRLQQQLKTLSDQFNKARTITPQDISTDEVGVGTIVDVVDQKGNSTTYKILGPWDASPEQNILSFQSKLAQSMIGCKIGDTFQFRDETLKVTGIKSYLSR